jgi:hypothetical protein
MTRHPTLSLVILLALSSGLLHADNAQPEKMKKCNQEANAKHLKGDERKTFMSSCLSAGAEPTVNMSQQDKMKKCNQEANDKHLKGDDRKSFMSSCLSSTAK